MQTNYTSDFSIKSKKLWEVMHTKCENSNGHLKVTLKQMQMFHLFLVTPKPFNHTLGLLFFIYFY